MATGITCHPPLGQTTVISSDEVHITICVELGQNAIEDSWEATLWYGRIGDEWAGLPFEKYTTTTDISVNVTSNQRSAYEYYGCIVPKQINSSQQLFTIKFRTQGQPWQWVKDAFGQQDGEILFQDCISMPDSLQSCFPALDPALDVMYISNPQKQTGVKVWEISDHVTGADDPRCGYSTRKIGKLDSFSRWFALVRHSTPWIAPRQGRGNILLDKDAVLCSFLTMDGLHMLLLAVTTNQVLTMLRTTEDGDLLMIGKNDGLESDQSIVIAGLGSNFEDTCAATISHAETVVRRSQPKISTARSIPAAEDVDTNASKLRSWYDGLTYCTWNALGQYLEQDMIHHALLVLSEHGVNVSNLLIDDGWQSLDHPGAGQFERGWTDFEAHEQGFPDKLRDLTTTIRHQHPTIQHIGVWHGVFGYWGAMSPDGNLAKRYKTKWFPVERDLCDRNAIAAVDSEHVSQLYTDFYKFLHESGVDSVKADTRYLLDCLAASNDRRDMIRRYHNVWLEASANYLQMRVISCMAMIPQLLFSPELFLKEDGPVLPQKLILRNSDDFFPEDDSSHLWHIFWNAHNAVFTRHLNVVLDWDMFQTTHAYSGFHAAARCVSGGPVCITDYPGKHNLPLIKQFLAKTPSGKDAVLRPTVMGRSVEVYTAHNEERFCRVAALQQVSSKVTGYSADIGILGVFNMSRQTQNEFIPHTDFLNFGTQTTKYVIRSFMTGKIITPMSNTTYPPLVRLELADKGYEILTLHPLISLRDDRTVAVFGLLQLMNGAAAITSIDVKVEDAIIIVKLKALGSFGLLVLGQQKSVDSTVTATLCGQPLPDKFQAVEQLDNGRVVKLDLDGAWNMLALSDQHILVEVTL